MARTTSANPATPPCLHPVPEGVASPDGRWLFVPAPQGGLDSVATASGELRWHRDDAALALLTDAKRVLVLAPMAAPVDGRWQLQWRSADTGAPLAAAGPAALLAPLQGAVGNWAVSASHFEGGQGGRLWLAWSARQFVAGKPTVAHGVLMLDPAQLDQPATAATWPQPPAWPGGVDDSPFADAGVPLPPWAVQQQVVALSVRTAASPGHRVLVLLRAATGEPAAASVLVDPLPQPGWLQALASPDPGLVTLLHTQPGGTSSWRLFAAPDGQPVASLPADDGLLLPFCRVGSVLLARELGSLANRRARPGRQLHAWQLDASTSQLVPLWQRALPTQSPLTLG